MEGWIKIHRKILTWQWYQSSDMVHLFLHLLLSANREEGSWRGIKVNRGQIVTGRCSLSRETGISEQKIRTCLDRLKSTSEITSRSTNKYTIITVCKYEDYQIKERVSNQQSNQQVNQQLTTNKNIRNIKNKSFYVFNPDFKPTNRYDSLAFILWKQCYDYRIESGIKPTILEKANPESWSSDFKLMIEKDGRTEKEIKEMLEFLKSDDFWRDNIQSPGSLRKQFEKLQLKANSQKKKKDRKSTESIIPEFKKGPGR